MRLDEGEIQSYDFIDQNETLILAGIRADRFVQGLAEHAELRVRVTKWEDEQITDRYDLADFSSAVAELQCKD